MVERWASCDLLKKCYLCSSNNNYRIHCYFHNCVVICSKNVTFAVATTITIPASIETAQL